MIIFAFTAVSPFVYIYFFVPPLFFEPPLFFVLTDGRTNRRTDGWTDGQMYEWKDGRTAGRSDGRTDVPKDGRTALEKCPLSPVSLNGKISTISIPAEISHLSRLGCIKLMAFHKNLVVRKFSDLSGKLAPLQMFRFVRPRVPSCQPSCKIFRGTRRPRQIVLTDGQTGHFGSF